MAADSTTKELPPLSSLPLGKGDPQFSAWGVWENPQLGSLNHLTDEVVLRTAKEEIQTGLRVGLNLPLDAISPTLLGRTGFEHKMINKAPRIINDDVISFNTQGSSQWDSFRHFADQKEAKFYNGVTQVDIHGENSQSKSPVNGINAWAAKGISGRGVLVDWYDYAKEHNIQYDALSGYPILLKHVKTILSKRVGTLRRGDILFLRTGYIEAYQNADSARREIVASSHDMPGLAQGQETLEWLWETQFAAVAADAPAFECVPPVVPDLALHPILLSGWGTPIGELFDLEELSKACKRLNRWTLFLTSAPLNYSGCVASPPNAIAFF